MSDNYIIKEPFDFISEKKRKEFEKYLRQNKFKNKECLDFLNVKEYTYVDKNFSPNENAYIIQFYVTRPLTKKQQFQKKLEMLKKSRSYEKDFDEAVSLYKEILKIEPLKKLSKEVVQMAVPHPKEVMENKDFYREKIDTIPQSILKTYFDKCISIEK
tara:strand:- start:377 stop:850 length:474 start_codon:yes stop_codon:yes gene_type:complete